MNSSFENNQARGRKLRSAQMRRQEWHMERRLVRVVELHQDSRAGHIHQNLQANITYANHIPACFDAATADRRQR